MPARRKSYDEVIEQTGLENLEHMPTFLNWVYEQVRPYLGKIILEAGSGIGTYVRLMKKERKKVYAVEFSDDYFPILQTRFEGVRSVVPIKEDLTSRAIVTKLKSKHIDTVLSLNVLEHIADDRRVMKHFYNILVPGGRAIILVPAHRWLHNSLDRALGHHRRYSARELKQKMEESGFVTEKVFLFNTLAILGWFLNGTVFRRQRVNPRAARLYNQVVPIARWLEKYVTRKRLGVSVIIVARKVV